MRRRSSFKPGRMVVARYGTRQVSGVVTGMRAGRVAVNIEIPGADEEIHVLLREDELETA
ncbi:hypothetical protein [Gordonia sp. MP11Mi]